MIEFSVPIETKSTSNLREHWRAKADRIAKQRRAVQYHGRSHVKSQLLPMISVSLTRISPRRLDDDNLQGALKAVRDEVASMLRVDDATELLAWYYSQESGPHSVRVTIEVHGQ